MICEIGSEFWDVPAAEENDLFPEDTQWFLSGRSALQAIINENCFRSVALPLWCCDSIIRPFADRNISVVFYKDRLPETDAALIMDFFGYRRPFVTEGYTGVVIRDLTHSLFNGAYSDADYYFGSLRKWAGFWTGGYAWGFRKPVVYDTSEKAEKYIGLRKTAMEQKSRYIRENSFGGGARSEDKGFLRVFGEAEDILEDISVCAGCRRDEYLARHLDAEFIGRKRKENAAILLNAFADLAVYPEIRENDCPMFVPIRVKQRNDLRRFLIQNDIYCPVHWPVSAYHRLSDADRKFYDEELSLLCDQRYSADDMFRLVETINRFFEKDT